MEFFWYRKTELLSGAVYDFIRTEIQLEKSTKKLESFVVMQQLDVSGVMHEVVKHDCAHGKYHVHRYYEGPHAKVIATTEPITNDLYWRAKRDVLKNWATYRERYIRKYLPHFLYHP